MPVRLTRIAGLLALALGVSASLASAQQVKTVFVISMENTNWAQNARQFTGSQQQIFQNPAAPWLNQLVTSNLMVNINGVPTNISAQTSYATRYHNVGANPTCATDLVAGDFAVVDVAADGVFGDPVDAGEFTDCEPSGELLLGRHSRGTLSRSCSVAGRCFRGLRHTV